jgi:glycosyltransferase involved in cell wall biosynthesis
MPAYNEIGSIAEILDVVRASLPGVSKEIVVVDDGSKDGTRAWLADKFKTISEEDIAKDAAAQVTRVSDECTVRVVFHSRNKGKGGAIQTAMRAATGAVLVIQDADLEYDPADWTEMYPLIAVFSPLPGEPADFAYFQRALQSNAHRYRDLLQDVHPRSPRLAEYHLERFWHRGPDQLPDCAGA